LRTVEKKESSVTHSEQQKAVVTLRVAAVIGLADNTVPPMLYAVHRAGQTAGLYSKRELWLTPHPDGWQDGSSFETDR
jgi:hypothetical protein